jgi:LacI family transcriptional regulator
MSGETLEPLGDNVSMHREAVRNIEDVAGGRKVSNVALLVETSREFGRGLLHGIARYSRLHGPWRFSWRPGSLDSPQPKWKNMCIHGAISRDIGNVRTNLPQNIPVVFVQHNLEDYRPYPAIVTDSEEISKLAVEHFFDRGFKNLAFCGFDEHVWSRKRGEFFRKHANEAGIEAKFYIRPSSKAKRAWKNEQNLVVEWLKALPKPIGLMCCNDDRALQVIEACVIAGLYVPDDVAVLGVDNDKLFCELSDPPISRISLNTEAAGYNAAKMLDSLMAGEQMKGQIIHVVGTHVVTRQSTDILAIQDADIVAALRFMRQNVGRNVQVEDVVRATMVSRRVLEKKFRSVLRRSLYREMRRIRAKYIVELLLSTDMSISEIAIKAGFDGVGHVARYFRKETGMGLRAYRRRYASH